MSSTALGSPDQASGVGGESAPLGMTSSRVARPRAWKLTVRHGSDVEHASFDDLGEAVATMRQRALEIRAEGAAKPVLGA